MTNETETKSIGISSKNSGPKDVGLRKVRGTAKEITEELAQTGPTLEKKKPTYFWGISQKEVSEPFLSEQNPHRDRGRRARSLLEKKNPSERGGGSPKVRGGG